MIAEIDIIYVMGQLLFSLPPKNEDGHFRVSDISKLENHE